MNLQRKMLVLGIVCMVFMALLFNVAGAADVVIKSVGFEDGESWGGMMPMPTQIRPISITTTEDKHSGAKSVKLDGQVGGYGAYLSSFPVTSGEIITIKFWAKSTNGGKLGFHGAYGISGYYSFPASSIWTEFTYNLNTSTSNYNPLQIILFGSTSGTTYYDDFLITRSAATPTPTLRPTATPVVTQPIYRYMVSYVISSDWGTGATVNVTITNPMPSPVNGWTLAFTFPGNQTIANLWNGTYTQSGAAVSVKDAGSNATIPANGGSVNFGFNLNYSGTNYKPTTFTLNGMACTVQ